MAGRPAFVARTGHRGVRAKDTPGFIVNHAGRAYGTEALKMLDEGIAERGDIDRILREGAGFRMGPLELLDYIGIDTAVLVCDALYEEFRGAATASRRSPCPCPPGQRQRPCPRRPSRRAAPS